MNVHYLKDVTVNNEAFLKDRFKFKINPLSFGDHWQNKIYNAFPYQFKNFVKDTLRKKIYLEKALWCFDLFSTGGYFHWLTEICPRLWIAKNHVEPDLPLLIPAYFLEKWPFAKELLKPFNRTLIPYRENELRIISYLTVISQPGGPFNYQPEPIKSSAEMMRKYFFKEDFKTTCSPNIYISRRKAGKRTVLNEDMVQALIMPYGYEILHTENMTISDQVNIFGRAKNVISIHGAGLANMVFMPEGGNIIEIRHQENNHMLNCFFTLAHTFSHKYYYSFGVNRDDSPYKTELRPEDKSVHADLKMLEDVLAAVHQEQRKQELS